MGCMREKELKGMETANQKEMAGKENRQNLLSCFIPCLLI